MAEPSDLLRQLAAKGRQLYARCVTARQSRRTAATRASLGVDLLDAFFDLSGAKTAAMKVGHLMAVQSSTFQEAALVADCDAWAKEVQNSLRDLVTVDKQGSPQSDGPLLAERFLKTQGFARPETRLARGIALLESLAERRILRTADLKALGGFGKAGRPPRVPEPVGGSLVMIEGEEVIQMLAGFTSEQEAVRGALAVLAARTPDHGRQALGSCRNALENLAKRLSGEDEWSLGLTKLVPSEMKRKQIRISHSFLSGYGPHGSDEPSAADVEMGLRLAFLAMKMVLGGRS